MTVPPEAGLQPERTRLAWRRTTLSVTVATVLATRLALSNGSVGRVLAAVALAGWVAALLVAHPRLVASRWRRSAAAVPLSALAAVAYAGLGILLVIHTAA